MKKFLLPFLLLAFLSPAFTALAEHPGGPGIPGMQPLAKCDERDKVLNLLLKKYKEVPIAIGVTTTGGLVEVLSSKEGTWTIIVSMPNGQSCLVAAGDGWRPLNPDSTDPEA